MYLNIDTKVFSTSIRKGMEHLEEVQEMVKKFTTPHPHYILLLKHYIFGSELKLANFLTLYV